MKKIILLLAMIAAAQVVLIGINWKGNRPLVSQVERSEMLSFERQHVDGLVIYGEGEELVLSKTASGWHTADGFPADKDKIDGLLLRLKDLQFGMPVATSAEALRRFKVADDLFNRRVQLKEGDTLVVDFYLGTGAGARRSHVRRADQDAVYAVDLGHYDLPVAVDEWQDKKVLQFKEDEVAGLTAEDIQLNRVVHPAKDEEPEKVNWVAANSGTAQVNEEQVNACVSGLARLSISKVLGDTAPEIDEKAAALSLDLELDKSTRQYRFNKIKGEARYLLKVSDFEEYFELENYVVNPLLEQCAGAEWIAPKEVQKEVQEEVSEEQQENSDSAGPQLQEE